MINAKIVIMFVKLVLTPVPTVSLALKVDTKMELPV